jgi:hypothetical protein
MPSIIVDVETNRTLKAKVPRIASSAPAKARYPFGRHSVSPTIVLAVFSALSRSPTHYKMQNQRDDSKHEQQVNQATSYVKYSEAADPRN